MSDYQKVEQSEGTDKTENEDHDIVELMPLDLELDPLDLKLLDESNSQPSQNSQSIWEYRLALIYLLLAPLIFSVMGLLVKLVGKVEVEGKKLDSWEIVAGRSVFQGLLSLGSIAAMNYRDSKKLPGPLLSYIGVPDVRIWLFVRALFGFGGMSCYYFALLHLPISEAIALTFTSPVWTAFLARILLKEPLHWTHYIGLAFSTIGVVLITRPSFLFGSSETSSHDRTVGLIAALLAPVFASMAFTAIRKIKQQASAPLIVLYISWVSLVASFIFMLIFSSPIVKITAELFLLLAAIGAFAYSGQVFLNKGFQVVPAGQASSFNYLQIVFGTIWGVLFLSEKLNFLTIIGSFLIGSYAFFVIYRGWNDKIKT